MEASLMPNSIIWYLVSAVPPISDFRPALAALEAPAPTPTATVTEAGVARILASEYAGGVVCPAAVDTGPVGGPAGGSGAGHYGRWRNTEQHLERGDGRRSLRSPCSGFCRDALGDGR